MAVRQPHSGPSARRRLPIASVTKTTSTSRRRATSCEEEIIPLAVRRRRQRRCSVHLVTEASSELNTFLASQRSQNRKNDAAGRRSGIRSLSSERSSRRLESLRSEIRGDFHSETREIAPLRRGSAPRTCPQPRNRTPNGGLGPHAFASRPCIRSISGRKLAASAADDQV